MAKMNIKKNLNEAFKKDALIDYAEAIAVPAYTAFAPSIFKTDGWLGFAIAYAPPILAGMLFKQRALTIAGLAMMAGHLVYEYGDTMFEQGLWALDPEAAGKAKDYVGEIEYYNTNSLPPGASLNYVNGEPVAAYPALQDFIYDENQVNFMNDNVNSFEKQDVLSYEDDNDRF